jgi:hypothetical protein
MGYTIQCGKCGHQNVLGRIFCTNCGQKLDFDQVDAKPRRQMQGMSPAKLMRIVITVVVIAILIMILKPAKPLGAPGTLQDAQRMNQKLRTIKAAILDNKGGSHELQEKEINGYLTEILKRMSDSATKGDKNPVKLRQINVHFTPQLIHVLMVTEIGPMKLSYSVAGQPARKDRQFKIKPERVRLGSVPIPAVAGDWIAGRMASVFSKLGNEKSLLDQVSTMQLGDGLVVVTFPGAQ